ncbi:2-hydroxychromene-2-carboxylate isomerase [Mastigocoleus sp. MO_188.B34]|uniref:2-hydroxychromene-2-carboxylate isomerase n=1 Tax=Mastigocoleus sp. MO_188.B34 TaxID=3036635 RepID=UPI00261FAB53|nr:2-hydroxychromene-2-carboxylate isomerase [Mastigocoleus sp. MO_188.B34]MDJ0697638.1 2-hydroxychromene-2-carboxylate isomerase [Mastigocoleus sp. MO_188.B34]
MKTIDFYYSIGSRYSYLASSQIKSLEQDFDCQVVWHPVNSVKLIKQNGNNPFEGEPASGQYEWNYRKTDAKRWAELYGIPYIEPRGRVKFDSDLLARACTAAQYLGKVEEYSRLLFKAMFEDSLSQIDERECVIRAETCGISASDFQSLLTGNKIKNQLNTTINRALESGVFGVPTFIVSGELFWGNDRIILLRHFLEK